VQARSKISLRTFRKTSLILGRPGSPLAEGPELKGSTCVYVHPTISNDTFRAEQNYLLTAAHVVLLMGYPEQSLLVPFDDSTQTDSLIW
jgi:hypothetical protein